MFSFRHFKSSIGTDCILTPGVNSVLMSYMCLLYERDSEMCFSLNLFLTSASSDQGATPNKEKEPRGHDTQKDLAVIAGLFLSLQCWFISLRLIEN